MGKRIVLISCVKQKQKKACKAKDLYTSPLFTKSWAYAESLAPDEIYILSAKHHLVEPDKVLEPYNKTLLNSTAKERKQWAEQVLQELSQKEMDLDKDEFIILAGKKYYQYLIGKGGIVHYTLPFKGLKGLGYILSFLTNKTSCQ